MADTDVRDEPGPHRGALEIASRIVEDAWQELKRTPYVRVQLREGPVQLPDLSLAEAERRSAVGRSLLERLGELDLTRLPHDFELTLRLVRFRARIWSREAEWYWIAVDPRGIGQFGLFLPTPYCGAYVLNFALQQLASLSLENGDDRERYLELVRDYARLVNQFSERTEGQAQRGIRLPRIQVLQARALLSGFKSNARAALVLAPQKFATKLPPRFSRNLERCIASSVDLAFERALEGLSDEYLSQATDTVGMGQYAGAGEVYCELVKQHTTLDLTPEEVHHRGLERMAEIENSIHELQAAMGFPHDTEAFLARLNSDPHWRVPTVEGVTDLFQSYIDRIEPHLPAYFSSTPTASCGVQPLPEALQGSMTYGYYDPPNKRRTQGLYLFNAKNLTSQSLFRIAALTYHELMPGHHLQIAGVQENTTLHPFRAHSFVNAYIEGWAEYAATLAGELGLYEAPEERYGRLEMDAFLTTRLVVDTGMNVMGWSLTRAREYMREHSRLAEPEVLTESVRYSCDIPAQALAYKLGDAQIVALRERMRRALGPAFNIRRFHASVVDPGALPLSDLEWHVEYATAQDAANSTLRYKP